MFITMPATSRLVEGLVFENRRPELGALAGLGLSGHETTLE